MTRSTTLIAMLAVASFTAGLQAGIPVPDAVLYSPLVIDGQIVPADGTYSVSARFNGVLLDRYTMGDSSQVGDGYVLRIPLETNIDGSDPDPKLVRVGETVQLYVVRNGICFGGSLDGTSCDTNEECPDGACGGPEEFFNEVLIEGSGVQNIGSPVCTEVADCADTDDDGIRDDGCTWWACNGGICEGTDIGYADMGGASGACMPEGTVDGHDRFHAINCFTNSGTDGNQPYPCENGSPFAYNVDAAGFEAPCTPDGVCDINDAFAALNTFTGQTTCSCGAQPNAPAQSVDAVRARLELVVDRSSVRPGDIVDVDVLLAAPMSDLRGYQLHLGVSGGGGGNVRLRDMHVQDRKDHVFDGQPDWRAFNVSTAQMLAGVDATDVAVPTGYLGTFTYRVSADAKGRFTIDVLHDADNPDHRTMLVPSSAGRRIVVEAVQPIVLEVRTK